MKIFNSSVVEILLIDFLFIDYIFIYVLFNIHWEKVLVIHFFFVRKAHKYFIILYYLYTLVLTTRLIK